MADLNDEVNAVSANLSKLSAEFDRYSRLTSGAAESSNSLSAAQRAAAAASRATTDSLYNLRKASGSLGSSLYEGRRGMSAFTTSTAQMAESASSFIELLAKAGGSLGNNKLFAGFLAGMSKISGGTAKVAATLYDLASNMADRQYDAYSKLSDTGAIASEGMTGVGTAAEKLGLNILKMDEYLSLVNENSKQLASFGTSVFDGRRKFENLGQALAGERENLFKLGMTQEQVNESMMGFIRLQNLAGKSQKMSSEELTASTRKYLYEQDALAKLLGMSRKEQQSAREAALSEQRFGAKIAAMRASGDAQQIAAADELEKQNLVLAKVSPELAQGFRDLTTGMMTTEAAQKANMSTQGQVLKDIQDVSSGLKTGGAGAYSSLQALAKTSEKFNMAYQMGTGENFLVKFAETQEARQFLERDFNKELKTILDERSKLISEDGKPVKPGGDPRLIQYAALLKDQQQVMIALQALVNRGININLSDGSKIKLSADTVVELQRGITDEIISFLQNNPYFKMDVRNTGKSTTDQIVSADTDLKKAKIETAQAKEAEDQAKKSLREEMEKVSLLEKAVKSGAASQATLDAENKKLQEAATRAKAAEATRMNAEKRLKEAEQRNEETKKKIKPVAETVTPEPAALKIDQVLALNNDQVLIEPKTNKLIAAEPNAIKVKERDDQVKLNNSSIQKSIVTAAENQLASLNEVNGNQKELADANKNLISVLGEQVKNIDTNAIQQLITAAKQQIVSMNETTSSLKDLTVANEKLISARDEQANIENSAATQKLMVTAAEKQLASLTETTSSWKNVTNANEKLIAAFDKQSNIDNITAIQKLVVTAAEKQLASLTETTSSWKNVTNANENLITSFDKQANIKDIATMQKLVVTAVQKQLASLTETTGSWKDITNANEKLIAARNKQENINDAAAIQKINEAKSAVIAAEKQLSSLNDTTASLEQLADANANLITARNKQVTAEKQLEKTLKDRIEAEKQLTPNQKKIEPNNPLPVKITPAPVTDKTETTNADKSKVAQLPELNVGSKVSYEELIQEQKDAINHLLANIGKLPGMGQSVDDDQVKLDREQKNKTNKNSNESVAPNDRRMNDIASLGADLSSALGANIKNIPTMSDLMINSDVATLSSKGMNITLDNSADISRMLAETVTAKSDVEKKDQSTARNSFENSLSDVKSVLTNQKDTNEMLLLAIQELIRVQKSGVSVNEKILAAQA